VKLPCAAASCVPSTYASSYVAISFAKLGPNSDADTSSGPQVVDLDRIVARHLS
jgi:hypothetical protein